MPEDFEKPHEAARTDFNPFLAEELWRMPNINLVEKFEDSTQLTSQVLRACQMLHNNGQYVLYGENTLDVFYESYLDETFASHEPFETDYGCSEILSVLNVRLSSEPLYASEFDQKSLINHVSSVAAGPSQLRNVASYFLDIYQTVSKFQKLRVTIGNALPGRESEIATAIQWLRELLTGKDVELSCLNRSGVNGRHEHGILMRTPKFVDFSACRWLRCRTFKITNSGRNAHKLAYIRSIEATVISQNPVIDLLKDMDNLWNELLCFWDTSTCDGEPHSYAICTDLWHNALNYDIEEYRFLRAKPMEAVKKHVHAEFMLAMKSIPHGLDEAKSGDQQTAQKINELKRKEEQLAWEIDRMGTI